MKLTEDRQEFITHAVISYCQHLKSFWLWYLFTCCESVSFICVDPTNQEELAAFKSMLVQALCW